MTHYILVKGINGFGNMISVLNVAYHLAKSSKRTLVIDWTHPEWRLGFDEYFSFKDKNINYLELNKFYEKIANKNVEVYPKFFKDNLKKNLIDLKPNIDRDNNYHDFFDNCIKYAEKKKYDIIVFSYNWLAYNDIKSLWNNLELKTPYDVLIQDKIKSLGDYKAIHIRNTDIKNVNLYWVIEFLINNKNKTIYLATDDGELLNNLKSQFDNIKNFTTYYDDNKPLHNCERSIEDKYKVNLDTLTDLYILVNSNELKISPIKTIPFMSTFSMLAQALK
jgi:hypothetical protein